MGVKADGTRKVPEMVSVAIVTHLGWHIVNQQDPEHSHV